MADTTDIEMSPERVVSMPALSQPRHLLPGKTLWLQEPYGTTALPLWRVTQRAQQCRASSPQAVTDSGKQSSLLVAWAFGQCSIARFVGSQRRRNVMGILVNRRSTTVATTVIAELIIMLNAYLVFRTVT